MNNAQEGRTMKDVYRTTFHRDGAVTIWDVYQQAWRRFLAAAVPDAIMASLDKKERARIRRIAAKFSRR